MANTFTWFGGSGSGGAPGNWSPSGPPQSGDTAIVNSGTLLLTDAQFVSNQLILNAGTFQISNDTGSVSASSFDLNTTLLAGASGAAEFDIFGPFVNDGTIAAVDHVVTVAIGAYTNGTSSAGTLINDGLIAVVSGGTLDVTQPSAGTFQGGNVVINDGSALIAASDFNSNFTLDNQAALELNSITESSTVDFNGAADLLKADAGAYDSVYTVTGFASGDTLDIGPGAVGTIVYDYPSSGLGGGPSQPTLTVVGTTGATLFSEAFTGPNGNAIGGNTGTFVAGTLTSGVEAAGQFELVTAGNGDTLVELLPPSTWSWIGPANGGTLNSPSNWQLVGGPGNQRNAPNSGDTAFGNNVTLSFGTDNGLSGNTIFVTGTSALDFIGDNGTTVVSNGFTNVIQPGINIGNPTIDGSSAISNDSSAAATTLNFAGNAVNQGFIISNASGIGNTMTLNVTQNGTAPGYFINDGEIEATAGNALTIGIAGTSELFNANLIYANGGSILITAGTVGTTSAIAGGYAPMAGGVALISGGGTIEVNAGFPSGTGGNTPGYAFADGASGDTLKIDQLSQFSGRILGFETGDTIDLGGSLAIGTISVKSDGRVLLENSGGTVIDTLVLNTGSYATGNFATTLVAAGTLVAGGFTLTTGTDGDTLLTTNVVNDFYSNVSGTWTTAANWSNGVPGAASTPIVGDGAQSPFVLTTGTGTLHLDSLTQVSGNSTIQVTNNVTVGTTNNQYGIQQLGGEIEVTGGNTLTAPTFRQVIGGSVLQVDAGGVLSITGHDNVGLVNNGTISQNAVVSGTTFSVGNTVGVFIAGTATVNGGEINAGPVLSGTSVVTTGGFINIGVGDDGDPATMTVENGGTVIDTYAQLGSDPASFGALTLSGPGSTWDDANDPTDTYNTRGYMVVGTDTQSGNQPSPSPSGTAQLLVENEATLNEATYADIGNSADSAGSATIASGGVWNIGTAGAASFLNVGNNGSGTLVVSGGAVNVANGTGTLISNGVTSTNNLGMTIGHKAGSSGTVVVENGGSLTVNGFRRGRRGRGRPGPAAGDRCRHDDCRRGHERGKQRRRCRHHRGWQPSRRWRGGRGQFPAANHRRRPADRPGRQRNAVGRLRRHGSVGRRIVSGRQLGRCNGLREYRRRPGHRLNQRHDRRQCGHRHGLCRVRRHHRTQWRRHHRWQFGRRNGLSRSRRRVGQFDDQRDNGRQRRRRHARPELRHHLGRQRRQRRQCPDRDDVHHEHQQRHGFQHCGRHRGQRGRHGGPQRGPDQRDERPQCRHR